MKRRFEMAGGAVFVVMKRTECRLGGWPVRGIWDHL